LLTGKEAIFGLWYKRKGSSTSHKVNPVIDESSAEEFNIVPLLIKRIDDSTLLKRGGGLISDKKVLIIGCGSVGSDLLFLLSRSGLKNFTIVDNDKLSVENTYKHFLGMDKSLMSNFKVSLLKKELENRYPNIQINAVESEILSAIKNDKINFNDYDLIIVAIGNPNVERKLNELIHETNTPAIFTWAEAYGLGGHALMTNNKGSGCYECLINKKDLSFSSSFAGKSDVPFIKNLNGCAGSYTPYGSMDSMETALKAPRLAMRYIQNQVSGNPLLSWKGSDKSFLEEGFETSDRYKNVPFETLYHDNYDYIDPECKICSKHVEVNL
jgi:molybdopterin/thiamine biosynthesis adenylyltransferase